MPASAVGSLSKRLLQINEWRHLRQGVSNVRVAQAMNERGEFEGWWKAAWNLFILLVIAAIIGAWTALQPGTTP